MRIKHTRLREMSKEELIEEFDSKVSFISTNGYFDNKNDEIRYNNLKKEILRRMECLKR